jgi:hypothetical protein
MPPYLETHVFLDDNQEGLKWKRKSVTQEYTLVIAGTLINHFIAGFFFWKKKQFELKVKSTLISPSMLSSSLREGRQLFGRCIYGPLDIRLNLRGQLAVWHHREEIQFRTALSMSCRQHDVEPELANGPFAKPEADGQWVYRQMMA